MLQAVIRKNGVNSEIVPQPQVSEGSVLIRVAFSCISAGTENVPVKSMSTPLLKRAMKHPDKVMKLLGSIQTDGVSETIRRTREKIDKGLPTGYSVSGTIIAVSPEIVGFTIGDKVAAAGAGLANHAEFVDVPENLVIKLPQDIDFREASTVALGGIALHGVRRCKLQFGEFVAVIGAGILGLIAVSGFVATGARVIVIDPDNDRLEKARILGAEYVFSPIDSEPAQQVMNITGGRGVDAVLFAAATSSKEPLAQAFQMCRRRARVVMVGVCDMDINRDDMYSKELELVMSTSYGPGRYDRNYEERGVDYPYEFVRWTENRNMAEYLRMVAKGTIDLSPLISAVYPVEDVSRAFESLNSLEEKPLLVFLSYNQQAADSNSMGSLSELMPSLTTRKNGKIRVGYIGPGAFSRNVHLPNLLKLGNSYSLIAVSAKTGLSAVSAQKDYGFVKSSTDVNEVLNDPDIDLIMIASRHGNHADLSLRALKSGKHVFVEKPLATTIQQLKQIAEFICDHRADMPLLMVGFNRRFSPYMQKIHQATRNRVNPLMIHYRMNAGYVPQDHWVHDDGGRIIGEACHIIDLMGFLTRSKAVSIMVDHTSPKTEYFNSIDNRCMTIRYADGSLATIHYFSSGSSKLTKEFMEIHFDGKSIVMDDYRQMFGYGIKGIDFQTKKSEKGQFEELQVLHDVLTGKIRHWPIEPWDMLQTTQLSLIASGSAGHYPLTEYPLHDNLVKFSGN